MKLPDNFMDPSAESVSPLQQLCTGPFYFKCQPRVGDCILNAWSDSSTSFKLLAIANLQSSQHTHSPLGGQTNKDIPRVCVTNSSY